MTALKSLGVSLFVLIFASGCNTFNIFGPVDNPSGDIQTLAYARACLNQGSFQCALNNYAKLTSVYDDISKSEQAMVILNQQGGTMGAFAAAFGTGSKNTTGGAAISKLAGTMSSGAGATRRTELGRAAILASSISSQSANLKHMTRFLVALVFFAAVLGEDTGSSTGMLATELATSPTACIAAFSNANCGMPSGKRIVTGTTLGGSSITLDVLTTSNLTSLLGGTSPTLFMIDAAVNTIGDALTQLGGGSSGVGQVAQSLITTLSGLDPDGGAFESPIYRRTMLQNGIGL